jgi:HlyD family secretion protein
VDLRVLPAIFRFKVPPDVEVYPGAMVDVYVGEAGKPAQQTPMQARRP